MTAKRLLDLAIAVPGLVLAAPLLCAVALAVRLALGPGVLFRQLRPGLHGKPFTILKFRTMREGDGADAERLTPFGRLLRSTSLDELPELLNVIRGDMSLVGPRPLLMRYLPRYSARQARRHEVPPGITGWAQVNGRNALSWEERLDLDVWYVDNRSLLLDLRILASTVWAVLSRRGISARGEATMPEFMGTESTGPEPAGPEPAGPEPAGPAAAESASEGRQATGSAPAKGSPQASGHRPPVPARSPHSPDFPDLPDAPNTPDTSGPPGSPRRD